MTYEDVMQIVGVFGRYQQRLLILIFCSTFTCALGTLSMIFTFYSPNHRCKMDKEIVNTSHFHKNCAVKITGIDTEEQTSLSASNCNELQPVQTQANCNVVVNVTDIPCQNGWTFEEQERTTLVTEFELVCSETWLKPLTVSLFMFGELIGSFSGGALSDKFGRRKVLLLSKLLEFSLFFIISFSPNVASYITLMVLSGAFIYSSYAIEFVLGNELMGSDHRNKMCISVYGGYCFGAATIPIFGYMFADWRWLKRFTGLIGLLYIPLYWLLPESPYWLLSTNKLKEASKLLKQIALANGKTLEEEDFEKLLKQEGEELLSKKDDEIQVRTTRPGLKQLVVNWTMRNRLLVAGLSWIVTNMVYYGLALNITTFSGDRFVNAAVSGLLEFPGIISGYLLVQWMGRPTSLTFLMGLGGICLAGAPFTELASSTFMICMVILGKTAIIGAFYINFSITGEMSPTLQRNIAIGLMSAVGKIGSFTAPYLMYLGETTNRYLPFLVMGGIACLSATLSLIVLPETKNEVLPGTLKDAINLKPRVTCKCCSTSKNQSY